MTIPETQNEILDGIEPFFMIQLNIINSRVFISFIAERPVLDIVGQVSAMRLLSRLCDPSKKISREELEDTRLEHSLLPANDLPASFQDLFIQRPIDIYLEDLSGSWKHSF